MARIRQKTIQYPGIDNEYTFADEADLFDAEEPWAVGDYCIYAGDLYRCTTDHTGSWNSEHFTAVKTGDELKSLNGAFTDMHIKSSISLFRRIAIIGDSYCAGEQYYSGSHHDLYPLSWGAIMAREAGAAVQIYAKGGQSTASFLDSTDASYNTYGYGKLVNDYAYTIKSGLFIIALGLNDAYQDTEGAQISAFSSRLTTIINNINSLNSNAAKIILLTFKRLRSTVASDEAYNTAIINVGQQLNIPVIDVRELDYFNHAAYTSRYDSSSHPTPDNYAGMAQAIKTAVEHTIVNNSYFGDYRFLVPVTDVDVLQSLINHIRSTTAKSAHTIVLPRSSAHLLLIYGGGAVTYDVMWVSATGSGIISVQEIARDNTSHPAAPVITTETDHLIITYNSDRYLDVYDFCVYGDMVSLMD